MTSHVTEEDLRPRGGAHHRLSVRLLVDVAVACVCALLVYGLLLLASKLISWLWVPRYDDLMVTSDRLMESFADFTHTHNIGRDERWEYADWIRTHPDTSLELYDDTGRILKMCHETFEQAERAMGSPMTDSEDTDMVIAPPTEPVVDLSRGDRDLVILEAFNLKDLSVVVRMTYLPKASVYRRFRRISRVLALLSFFAWTYLLQRRKVKELRRITAELLSLPDRKTPTHVGSRSHDELGVLAAAVDRVSLKVLSRRQQWERAREEELEMVRNVTHDLRTPLTALIGYLEILTTQDQLTAEDRRRYLEHARHKAVQLRESSNEVFEHFLIETKHGRKPLILMDGNLFTAQWAELLAADLDALGFDLETSFTDESFQIRIDQTMFDRILNNLLNNISHYADPASPCYFKTSILQPSKVDKGAGFGENPPEAHAYVSMALCNKIAKRPNRGESSGLGLENVRQMMEAHGGYLRVSETQRQFCVRLILPLARPDEEGT